MIVKGTEVHHRTVEIEVRPYDAFEAIRQHVLKSLGCRPDAFVNKAGHLVYDSHGGGGGHSWVDEIVLDKNPSAQITGALAALNTIHSILIRD